MQGKCHSLFISKFPFVLFTASQGNNVEESPALSPCCFSPHLLLKPWQRGAAEG